MSAPSRTQLDQTGERIRAGTATAADWRVLTEYRLSVRDAVAPLLQQVRDIAAAQRYPFTARLKTDYSVEQKLRRTTVRLRQIDDIIGCRIIVPDRTVQNVLTTGIAALGNAKVRDRREQPSNGYRAVHVILGSDAHLEVQIRTEFQDAWAELSERLADKYGIEVKYGGGPRNVWFHMLRLQVYIDVLERNPDVPANQLGLPWGSSANDVKLAVASIEKALL